MDKGMAAEERAAAYLEARGLTTVARNWRAKGGELDLVMREGPTLVFVEVRARNSSRYGGAAASITPQKQARLIHAARLYLARLSPTPPCRFDAILEQEGQLTWLRDAFQADD